MSSATREETADLWILIYHHRHGQDIYPVRVNTEADLPDGEVVIGDEWEGEDAGEWWEWRGPFQVPNVPQLGRWED